LTTATARGRRAAPSLRRNLTLLLVAVTSLAWTLSGLWVYFDARAEADTMLDANLAQTARVLLSLARHEIIEGELGEIDILDPSVATHHAYETRVVAVIRDSAGKVMMRSPHAPSLDVYPESGFREQRTDGVAWRVFTMRDDKLGTTVQTAHSYRVRNALARKLVWHSFGPLLLLIPVVLAALVVVLRAGLAPLKRLTTEVGLRAPEQLTPIEADHAPHEVRPLIVAINGLLAKLGAALERERRFAADASHEMRTPLAVLHTHAQVAERSTDPAQRERSLAAIVQTVTHCTRMVESLLTLSRLDADGSNALSDTVNLCEIAHDVVITHASSAESHGIELRLIAPQAPCMIRGNVDALHILLRNLIKNALNHTHGPGHVTVEVATDHDGTTLEVTDTGPGIPSVERARVLERFHRLPGTHAPGSGLGLSIVTRIARLHQALLILDDGPQGIGLKVSIKFPAPGSRPT